MNRSWKAERVGVALLGAAAVMITVWATGRYGLALSHDSFAYAATGQRISSGGGGGYWLDPVLTVWPLGYPALIAGVIKLSGGGPLAAARLLQCGLVGVNVVVVWMIARRVVADWRLRLAVTAAVGLSTLTLGFGRSLLVETASTLVASSVVWWLLRRWRCWDATTAIGIALMIGIGWLIHYRNVVIVVAVAVAVVGDRGSTRRRRAAFILQTVLLSSIVPVAYAVWNRTRGGEALGQRDAGHLTISQWVRTVGSTVGGWLLGRPMQGGPAVIAGIVAVAAVAIVLIAGRAASRSPAMVVLRYGVSLFAAICAIRVMVVFDLDGRTLAMCFAPVVVGLAGVAEVVGSRAVARLTIAVWSVIVVGLSVVAAAEFRSHGSGGSSAALAPMRADLRSDGFGRALAGCQVSSNRPQMVWLARSEEVPYFDQETREHPHGCVVVLSGFDEITPPASWGCAFSTADVAVYRADLSASTLCPGADTSRVSG